MSVHTVSKPLTLAQSIQTIESLCRWVERLSSPQAGEYDRTNAMWDVNHARAKVEASRPPTLSAGVPGVWSGTATAENGISLSDHTDRNNDPAMITTRQTNGAAYKCAAKVWAQLESAKTMSQAGDILSKAGCKLHYYCRVD